MIPQLSALEARVIGSLIEKQITTPDQYPLSLNALVLACNQKSNRDPVLELDERAVQDVLDTLMRKHLVLEKSGFGSRVPKFQQLFCNTEFSTLQFTPQERAIVCELLLRGPQTPGELRSRASRMAEFTDVAQVEAALEQLAQHEGGARVVRLPREPGRRDARYAHLFSGEVLAAPAAASLVTPSGAGAPVTEQPATIERLAAVERQVSELRAEVQSLRQALADRN
ncbi:MAG TPA: DUF480 domain-containing protein [Steroidobacteraceae bacterium]|jgi:hypothetical protein